jgi:hypothetical protein
MPIRQVPQNYPITWIKASMKIGQRHWGLFIAIGAFTLLTGFSVGLIPFIGYVFASILGFVVLVGELRMYKKILRHEPVNFETFMNLVFDPVIFRKFQPYLVIVLVVSLLETFVVHSGLKFMNLTLVIPTVFISIVGYAAFSEIENPVLNPSEAIKYVLKGLWKNIIACLACAILVMVFSFVCAIACFVPLFLVAMPFLLAVKYLIYASIFEDLDVDQTLAEWTILTAKVTPTTDSQPTEPPAL